MVRGEDIGLYREQEAWDRLGKDVPDDVGMWRVDSNWGRTARTASNNPIARYNKRSSEISAQYYRNVLPDRMCTTIKTLGGNLAIGSKKDCNYY